MNRDPFTVAHQPAPAEQASGAPVNSKPQGELPITSEGDIVAARKLVRNAATALGFGLIDVTRIVTAASELTRNIYQYANVGVMRWQSVRKGAIVGLELVFEDHGPGIADVDKALEAGFTTGRGLGLGLPGAKRLMDEMSIHSSPGHGTLVEVRKWLK
jgi:serine/threonine-protein kinase RsbT